MDFFEDFVQLIFMTRIKNDFGTGAPRQGQNLF